MKKIVIAGGKGFLGNCLSNFFIAKGYLVYILSRKNHLDSPNLFHYKWDGSKLNSWSAILENADALINLTGKSVDCRYNEDNKQLIYDSRLNATNVLGSAVSQCKNPPKVWINAASATIYRHSLDRPMDEENGEIGIGFSVDVCKKWEKAFNDQFVPNTRKIIFRTSIVLGKNGGALQPLKYLAKFGLGGKQGSGKQYFSWIHEKDFVNIVDYTINNPSISGVYNVTAPYPLKNYELMTHLRKSLKIPFGLPMPGWFLKIGAYIINTETELILKSRYVIPEKLLKEKYNFLFPKIQDAFKDLIKR